MDVGIAYVEYPSPFTVFKIDQDEMEINHFAMMGHQLFAGTETGLFKLARNEVGQQAFKKVKAFEHKIWGLVAIDNRLIVADEYGIHEMLQNGSINTILKGLTPGAQRSSVNPNRIYVFLGNGITSLLFDNGKWHQDTLIPEFNRRVRKVIERDDHSIWLDSDWTESWEVNFSGDSGQYYWYEPQLTKYDTSSGMPKERGNLYEVAGALYFVPRSNSSNFLWNEDSSRFEIESQFYKVLNVPERDAILWDVDDEKNCWYVTNYGTGGEHLGLSWSETGGKYRSSGLQFDRILDDIGNAILIDGDTIWHGGFSSIVKQNIHAKWHSAKPLVSISKVIYQTDSTLSSGIYNQIKPRLVHKQNAIDFQYGITEFDLTNSVLFQTYLAGYDSNWSEWSKEKHRQFFGLSPGEYIFQVRARDGEDQDSQIGQYTFTILSPWYRQWWAYGLYLSWGILIIGAIVRWRSAELIQENEKLEAIVRQRTEEVEIRNQQLEEQKSTLAEQAQKLQDLDQLKTNLFANISHEFRTPLTLIKAPVEQLEREPDKTLTLDEVGMIRRNADRLLRLVNQLLDLAKLDARSLKLDFTEGDVYRFFRVEASSFSSLAAQKNIDFEIKIPTEQLWASFDREKLETIVYNLLNNAFKFTPAGGEVKLVVNHQDNELQLEVADTGSGISGEHLDQVFNRFYQVEKIGKAGDGGTGIGLALCRELATLMKGEITVKSRLDYGTSFYLTIPLVEIINSNFFHEEEIIVGQRTVGSSSGVQKLTKASEIVLLVEDHPDMRRYIKSVLEKDYFIVEAEDGKSGFEKAINEIPDLIITDTMMPLMDGHEFSQAIKSDERTSHIPVIMLTAKATLENKLSSLSAGVDSYLTKPFHAQELKASIKALLLERKRLRRLFSRQLLVAPKEISINSLDQQFLERVNTVLESQYSDSTFGVPQMQMALVMSKTQLHRKLTAITNQAPGEFLRNFRLQRAAQILAQKGETVTQVAYAVGFENLPYFTKCFKELFGVNPSQYGK
jgi:signal transduction histidine kinase/DNA-binding response OmpR family regulator